MLPCHIVRDLLPSYLEHLTGPETEADICEHLESCPDCRAARDAMAADLKAEKAPPPKLNFLKRLRWQQRLGAVLSVAATLLCLVGLYRLGPDRHGGDEGDHPGGSGIHFWISVSRRGGCSGNCDGKGSDVCSVPAGTEWNV